jgi:hypothetical protein
MDSWEKEEALSDWQHDINIVWDQQWHISLVVMVTTVLWDALLSESKNWKGFETVKTEQKTKSSKVTNCLDISWKFLLSLPLQHNVFVPGNVMFSPHFTIVQINMGSLAVKGKTQIYFCAIKERHRCNNIGIINVYKSHYDLFAT